MPLQGMTLSGSPLSVNFWICIQIRDDTAGSDAGDDTAVSNAGDDSAGLSAGDDPAGNVETLFPGY